MKPLPLLTFFALVSSLLVFGQTPHSDSARMRTDTIRQTDKGKADASKAGPSADTGRAGAAGVKMKSDTAAAAGAVADPDAEGDGYGSPVVAVVLLVGVAIVAGACIAGALVAAFILGVFFLLATGGVLSAGVLVGLYRRSVTAGFKAVLLIGGGLGGMMAGAGGFYAINRYIGPHFRARTAIFTGAGSGLIGGLLLGLIVFVAIRALLRFLKQKLAF